MSTDRLPVAELFGPTWQGEGPHAGRRCWFLRLGHCNLSCEWCDSAFTWDRDRFDVDAECPKLTAAELWMRFPRGTSDLLVLSGGEPLIWQRHPVLLDALSRYPGPVHVETNGTISPAPELLPRVDLFTVSPKLASSNAGPEHRRIRPAVLAGFAAIARGPQPGAVFKFVVRSEADVWEASELCDAHRVPSSARWFMPEGTEPGALLAVARDVAPVVRLAGGNLTLRQQTLMYGMERGR